MTKNSVVKKSVQSTTEKRSVKSNIKSPVKKPVVKEEIDPALKKRMNRRFKPVIPPLAELQALKARLEIEHPDRNYRISKVGVQRLYLRPKNDKWETVCDCGIMKSRCSKCCPQERKCKHGRIESDCHACGHGAVPCEHKANKRFCAECDGSGLCQAHKKNKYLCQPCGSKSYCPCGTLKWLCVPCGGSQICPCGKLKRFCVDCGGKDICEHQIRVHGCRECSNGSLFCEPHGRRKRRCLECGGEDFCRHKILKQNCLECDGSAFCKPHGKFKSICVDCGGSAICGHGRARYVCRECEGNGICKHDKFRWLCIECGGNSLCVVDGCTKRHQKDGFCTTCHPDFIPSMHGASKIGCLCIDLTERELQIDLQHKHYCTISEKVVGSEFRPPEAPKFPVDGYEEDSKTMFEFLGDVYHGHPALSANDPNAKNYHGKVYVELFAKAQAKFVMMVSHGYTVYYIWEREFIHHMKHCGDDSLFAKWRKFDGSLKY
jgi:hypothetical protein